MVGLFGTSSNRPLLSILGFPKGKLAGGGFDFQDWAKPKPGVVWFLDFVQTLPPPSKWGEAPDCFATFDFPPASFPFGKPPPRQDCLGLCPIQTFHFQEWAKPKPKRRSLQLRLCRKTQGGGKVDFVNTYHARFVWFGLCPIQTILAGLKTTFFSTQGLGFAQS